MLISPSTEPNGLHETGLRWHKGSRFTIGWKGHLFLAGLTGGEESVRRLAELLATRPLAELASDILGIYGLFIHDAQDRTWRAMSDNAGMYKVFHDRRGLSTSFLKLIQARGTQAKDTRVEAVVEYLAQGALFGTYTFVEGVGRLGHDEILILASGRPPILQKKVLRAPSDDSTATFVASFEGLARSLKGRRLSVDATGGYDSRVIVCLLKRQGLDFEAAISGLPGTADTRIAQRVADCVNVPFHLYEHDLGGLDDDLERVFLAGDGITDLRRFHRDHNNARARLARGVEIIAHGGAGELFKDQHTLQDFPFYGSSKINLARYYDLRVSPVSMSETDFTSKCAEIFKGMRSRSIKFLESVNSRTNNETYNRIYFFVRSPDLFGQFYSNYINMGLDVAAPYLDYRNAQIGIRLPPWQSFFTRWHRRVLTAHCPRLAALPTAEGYTASDAWRHLPRNLTGFTLTQIRRGAKKASQRLTGKSRFYRAGAFVADAGNFMGGLRQSRQYASAIERLKSAGILAPDLDPAGVHDAHVGRMMTMGLLLRRLDG